VLSQEKGTAFFGASIYFMLLHNSSKYSTNNRGSSYFTGNSSDGNSPSLSKPIASFMPGMVKMSIRKRYNHPSSGRKVFKITYYLPGCLHFFYSKWIYICCSR
jgi:hypothetical protein